jgi:hypothetical protein
MEGDAYEMEDQRNWTDASYKTYMRPLSKPWPYLLPAGEEFTQSVTVTCRGTLPRASATTDARPAELRLGASAGGRMPQIGLGVPSGEAKASLEVADLIRRTGIKALVCEYDCRRQQGDAPVSDYAELSAATGAGVVLEITLRGDGDPEPELRQVALCSAAGLNPSAVTVSPAQHLKSYQPDGNWPVTPSFKSMYEAARKCFPGVSLGGGMYSYFTELNRCRPPAELLDFVTHTTLPIVHAADDISVMETLEALPHIIRTPRSFIKGRPYRVGPSALAARHNPYGEATAANPSNARVCLAAIDPRQRGLFGAAWVLGYIEAMAHGGIDVVSIGAPTGPSGIVARKMDLPQPYFDALTGPAVYPV